MSRKHCLAIVSIYAALLGSPFSQSNVWAPALKKAQTLLLLDDDLGG